MKSRKFLDVGKIYIWAGNINLQVTDVLIVNEAMRIDDLNKKKELLEFCKTTGVIR